MSKDKRLSVLADELRLMDAAPRATVQASRAVDRAVTAADAVLSERGERITAQSRAAVWDEARRLA